MKGRNQSLDVLRGAAILLVLGRHSQYVTLLHRAGWIGVDLFFVLSGFLISGLLFTEYKSVGKINLTRFLIRRGFKIYPPFYFFLLLLLPFTIHAVRASDFLFMQSYLPAFWGHGWSLAVEEHYLLLPLILILSCKLWPQSEFSWIPYALPVVVVACLAMRLHLGPGANQQMTDATHLRADALFAGVTLGWFHHFTKGGIALKHKNYFALAGLLLISPMFLVGLESYFAYTWGFTANLLGFSCILIWGINTQRLARLSLLSTIGRYSYSIYLWHWPIAGFFVAAWPNTLVSFAAYLTVAASVGVAMSEIVEVPMLRLRDRFFSLPAQPYSSQSGTVLSSSTSKGGPAAYDVSQILSDFHGRA